MPKHPRTADLIKALRRGHVSNGNHTIQTREGMLADARWCRHCPAAMSCYLADKRIEVEDAVRAGYACIRPQHRIDFYYHGALCLRYDHGARRLNDFGYWGYSVTTSRSIKWYIQALENLEYITPKQGTAAVHFFRARCKDTTPNGKEANNAWFHIET